MIHLLLQRRFRAGDHVVYRMQKFSNNPGPRAENVDPAARGEGYRYSVSKLWTVVGVGSDGDVEVVTPGGKRHTLSASDPNLRRAGWMTELLLKLRYNKDFPSVDQAVA
jgi:hypothetical protein